MAAKAGSAGSAPAATIRSPRRGSWASSATTISWTCTARTSRTSRASDPWRRSPERGTSAAGSAIWSRRRSWPTSMAAIRRRGLIVRSSLTLSSRSLPYRSEPSSTRTPTAAGSLAAAPNTRSTCRGFPSADCFGAPNIATPSIRPLTFRFSSTQALRWAWPSTARKPYKRLRPGWSGASTSAARSPLGTETEAHVRKNDKPGTKIPGFVCWEPLVGPLSEPHDGAGAAGFGRRRVRLADHQAIGLGKRRHHRAVLDGKGRRHEAVRFVGQGRAQIIGALVVLRQIAAEPYRFGQGDEIAATAQPADERHQEQKRAHIGRHRIAGQSQHRHRAEPAVHQRAPGPHRHFPE